MTTETRKETNIFLLRNLKKYFFKDFRNLLYDDIKYIEYIIR